jgi:hypothetical protein
MADKLAINLAEQEVTIPYKNLSYYLGLEQSCHLNKGNEQKRRQEQANSHSHNNICIYTEIILAFQVSSIYF